MKKLITTLSFCAAIALTTPALANGANHHNNNTNIVNSDNTRNINRNTNEISNRNTNTNLNLSNSNSVSNSSSVSSSDASSNSGASSISNSGASGGEATVTMEYEEAASSALAPALSAGGDTCMGSSSGGVQGTTFGFSAGTTWTDEACVRRKDAKFLAMVGLPDAALSLMCQDKKIAKAVLTARGSDPKAHVLCAKSAEEEKVSKKESVSSDFDNLRD